MLDEYDFSAGQRGAFLPSTDKTRVTYYLDNEVLAALRTQAIAEGTGYQTIINRVL